MVELQGKPAAKDPQIKSAGQDSGTTLESSIRKLVKNFRVGYNKSVSDAFDLFTLTHKYMQILPSMVSLFIFRRL